MTPSRKSLWVLMVEGIPATIVQTLLGGQFLSGYLLYLGATSTQMGLIFAIPTLTNVAQLFMAFFSQRLKNRKWPFVFLASVHRILWSLTGFIPFVFDKAMWIPVFILLYTVAFIGNATGGMMWTALCGDMVHPRIQGRFFGIRNTFLNILTTLSLFFGAAILQDHPGEAGFRLLFIIIGIFAVINCFAFTLYPNPHFERSVESKFLPMVLRPLRDSAFMKPTIFLTVWSFMQSIVIPFFTTIMLKQLEMSQGQVSIVTIVQTIAMTCSFYIWGNLNAKYSNKQLLFWTLPLITLSCLTWGLISFMPALPVLLMALACYGIGIGGFNQLVFNFTIGDTPKSERPMFIAVYSAMTGIGAFVGPIVGGRIYDAIADSPKWMQIYGLNLVMGVVLTLLVVFPARKILK
ncbi:MFS transporter [Gorillibacterium massiliense]|uniref:MFS transporter n=1 Tax=Gorillibacterium massiliense TaxID=1280390 RepID=UPI0004AE90BA|nr:MFS transporter [Gorillibacterium massiliense]